MSGVTLAQALRSDHEQSLVRQAEIIRDWRPGRERDEQATIHVRLALWEQGIGRLSRQAQQRVYSILSFVMPQDGAYGGESLPIAELQREADAETAYFEQLQRQSCPDCGEGICPVEPEDTPQPRGC